MYIGAARSGEGAQSSHTGVQKTKQNKTKQSKSGARITSESTEAEPKRGVENLSYPRYQCAYSRGLARGPAITVLEKIKEAEVRPQVKVD